MAIKPHYCMRISLFLVLVLATACTMQVSENDTPTSDSTDAASPSVDTSRPDRGGMNCAKPIYLMIDGKQYYQPGMCPIPSLKEPEPDPAVDKAPGIDPIIQPEHSMH